MNDHRASLPRTETASGVLLLVAAPVGIMTAYALIHLAWGVVMFAVCELHRAVLSMSPRSAHTSNGFCNVAASVLTEFLKGQGDVRTGYRLDETFFRIPAAGIWAGLSVGLAAGFANLFARNSVAPRDLAYAVGLAALAIGYDDVSSDNLVGSVVMAVFVLFGLVGVTHELEYKARG